MTQHMKDIAGLAPTGAAFAEALLSAIGRAPGGRVAGGCGAVLTHGDMLARVAQIRVGLAGLPDGPVAICAAKRPDTIAAVLAVLADGRAYAPLDPGHPEDRLTGILDLLRPAALLVDALAEDRLRGWASAAGVALRRLDALTVLAEPPCPRPDGGLAALLHTSGSTGVPKQVRIAAPALDQFNAWVRWEFGLRPQDCLLSHAPLAFDLSFLDIFAGLSVGASLALADAETARSGERLLRLIREAGVTVVQAAPSALALMVRAAEGQCFPAVRAVLFAGEPMPAPVLRDIFRVFPAARVVNIYGCTETNDTFFYDVPRADTPDPLPLGRPLPYVCHEVMTEEGHPVPIGEEGELWVACPTTMEGYSDPALTARAFGHWHGRRYYRSNDRVRLGEDGLMHFLGRADSVQKISGHRVDLAEVEAHLARLPGVVELAVYVVRRGDEAQVECAVATDGRALGSLDLRRHAMTALPAPAIPRRYAISAEPLPKNSNGKICRRMLASLALAV